MEFTLELLIRFPKCYVLFYHRLWTLKKIESKEGIMIIDKEIGLINKMLNLDTRNCNSLIIL